VHAESFQLEEVSEARRTTGAEDVVFVPTLEVMATPITLPYAKSICTADDVLGDRVSKGTDIVTEKRIEWPGENNGSLLSGLRPSELVLGRRSVDMFAVLEYFPGATVDENVRQGSTETKGGAYTVVHDQVYWYLLASYRGLALSSAHKKTEFWAATLRLPPKTVA